MNDSEQTSRAQLQQAYEAGLLDETTYREALAELDERPQAEAGSGPGRRGGDSGGSIITGQNVGEIINSIGVAIGRGARATVNILQNQESLRQQRDRQAMIQMVREFWIDGVLEKSLYQGQGIEIGLEGRPQAVDNRPWQETVHLPQVEMGSLPPAATVVDIFYGLNALNRSLLILGAPGSGKTTLLLSLARAALQSAESDPTQPIPVVFNLASWDVKRQSIAEWLVSEMTNKYVVPAKIGRPWVEQDELLLLLDGLDEVEPAHQADCVQAINEFHHQQRMPIVVCAREQEYAALPARLQFQMAVSLQELTQEQVHSYVSRAGGEALVDLDQLLQRDASLGEMAQSPLLLNTMMQTFQADVVADWPASSPGTANHQHLFGAYVGRMFQRGRAVHPFSQEKTIAWLSWLARQMQAHSQAIFLIERLQPGWLPGRAQRWLYLLLSRMTVSLLSGVLGGAILGLGFTTFFAATLAEGLQRGLSEGVLSCLVAGLVVVLVDGWRLESSGWRLPLPAQGLNFRLGLNTLAVGALVYLSVWQSTGIVLGGRQWMGLDQRFWFEEGQMIGLLLGLCYSLIFGFSTRNRRQILTEDVQTVEFLRWSRTGTFLGAAYGLLAGGISGLLLWLAPSSERYADAITFLFADARVLFISIPILTLAGAIFGGLNGRIVQTTTRPNQGIRLSAVNAAVLGGAVGVLFGLLGGIIGWLLAGPIAGLTLAAYGLFFGLLAAIWYGGLDVIKHFSLRIVLTWSGRMPRAYARFLDYAAERILLRKVGGGYIFLHRLLADYFSKLEAAGPG